MDTLPDGKFRSRLRVRITSSSTVAKKKTIPAPSLDCISNLCRTDGLFIRLYHLDFLGIQHARSELLDLLLKRRSIRYVPRHRKHRLLDLIDSNLRKAKTIQNTTKITTDLKSPLKKDGFKPVFFFINDDVKSLRISL